MRRFVLLAVLAPGCTSQDGASLSVFAASSLTEAFTDLERDFEGRHRGVDVSVAFAGSQVLRLQIEQGAPADIFASADVRHMSALVDAGLVTRSEVFATNELVVIVPADDGPRVATFSDLPHAERIVLGTENVPVGAYTEELLERAGEAFAAAVRTHVVSRESNVRLVRAKIELGEADAAIVYRTDATSSSAVRVIPIPDDLQVRAEYHVGQLARSQHAELATAFVAFVASDAGRAVLARHGFAP